MKTKEKKTEKLICGFMNECTNLKRIITECDGIGQSCCEFCARSYLLKDYFIPRKNNAG